MSDLILGTLIADIFSGGIASAGHYFDCCQALFLYEFHLLNIFPYIENLFSFNLYFYRNSSLIYVC